MNKKHESEIKRMKLSDLKNVIEFTFDLQDDEVCGRIHIDLDEINEKYARQIEVVKIDSNYVTCKLTDFLRHHKTAVSKYIRKNYNVCAKRKFLENALVDSDNITEDGGEAVYYFIISELYDFLSQK